MKLYSLYRRANLLSLDVVAGAICSCLFFNEVLSIPVNGYCLLALALTVWTVYTTDHLVDGLTSSATSLSPRRLYHLTHAQGLFFAALTAAMAGFFVVFFLPVHTILFGFFLTGAVILYLVVQNKLKWMKELVVAMFYAAGVIISTGAEIQVIAKASWIWFAFALVALLNLLIFSWFDYVSDERDGHSSAMTFLGRRTGAALIWLVFTGIMAVLMVRWSGAPAWALLTMAVCHMILFVFPRHFEKNDRFRIIGDAIFYLPVLLIFV